MMVGIACWFEERFKGRLIPLALLHRESLLLKEGLDSGHVSQCVL